MAKLGPHDLVLVAIMPSPQDLEIARVLGWYRIPLRTAPKMIRVDWIAFYLTGVFKEERWSIRYLAPVRGHELVRRRELLTLDVGHPDADEPYLKIRLGPLQQLARPIPARKWRRLTFLYTTGQRLLSASDLADLTLSAGDGKQVREGAQGH